MEKAKMESYVRTFLILLFIGWAFRLAIKFDAQMDAIGMLIFSMLIYASRKK